MNHTIADLTLKLQRALDSNYDVVDMATVLFVISQLEGTTITKEQLETTRLAKYINHLRRRTWSEQLARRAKNLLKKWREMVMPTLVSQPQTQATQPAELLQVHSEPPSPVMRHHHHHLHQQQPQQLQQSQQQYRNEKMLISSIDDYNPSSGINTGSANKRQNNLLSNGGHHRNVDQASLNIVTSPNWMNSAKNTIQRVGDSDDNPLLKASSNPAHLIAAASSLQQQHSSYQKQPYSSNKRTYNENHTQYQQQLPATTSQQFSASGRTNAGPSSTYIEDNRSQSPIILTLPRKRTDDRWTNSFEFDNNSNQSHDMGSMSNTAGTISSNNNNSNINNICSRRNKALLNGDHNTIGSSLDLHDSNSGSNLINPKTFHQQLRSKDEQHFPVGSIMKNSLPNETQSVGNVIDHRKSKKHKKDKKRNKQPEKMNSDNQLSSVNLRSSNSSLQRGNEQTITSDETQLCASTSFLPHDSLSNSSMSLFPSTSTNTTVMHNNIRLDNDLTFAGKFKNATSTSTTIVTNSAGSTVAPITNLCGSVDSNSIGDNIIDVDSSLDVNKIDSSFMQFLSKHKKANPRNIVPFVDFAESRSCSPFGLMGGENSNDSIESHSQLINHNVIDMVQSVSQGFDIINQTTNLSQPMKHQPESVQMLKQHHQAELVAANQQQQVKIVKKRGRKKGSKGVDAMLAQTNALRNSQLFENTGLLKMSSFKKVKTTKELLADIQSRKLGSATSSPTLMPSQSQPLPSPSSGSEASLQSVSNSDIRSTSATPLSTSTMAQLTPDRHAASSNALRLLGKKSSTDSDSLLKFKKREGKLLMDDADSITTDYNSGTDSDATALTESISTNFIDHSKHFKTDEQSDQHPLHQLQQLQQLDQQNSEHPLRTIEDDIIELQNLLPPINSSQIRWDDDTVVICTCTLRETNPNELITSKNENVTDDDIKTNIDTEEVSNNGSFKGKFDLQTIKTETNKNRPITNMSTDLTSSRLAVPSTAPLEHPNTTADTKPQKPVKSIFDLDYDEDDDPLHSYVEAAKYGSTANRNNDTNSNNNINNNNNSSNSNSGNQHIHDIKPEAISFKEEDDDNDEKVISIPVVPPTEESLYQSTGWGSLSMVLMQQKQQEQQPQMFPLYEVVEDPNCPAKKRYETQTNCIAKFHVNALHNFFIENINGNWDHSVPKNPDENDDGHLKELDADPINRYALYERVVPQYNHIIVDKIPKDLSHIHFTLNYHKIKKDKQQRAHKRKRQRSSEPKRTHKHQRRKPFENNCNDDNKNNINSNENDHINNSDANISSNNNIVDNDKIQMSNIKEEHSIDEINVDIGNNDCTDNISGKNLLCNDISLDDIKKPKKSMKILKNIDNLNIFKNEKENVSSYNNNNNSKLNDDEDNKSDLAIRDNMLYKITTESSSVTTTESITVGTSSAVVDAGAPTAVTIDHNSSSNSHNSSCSNISSSQNSNNNNNSKNNNNDNHDNHENNDNKNNNDNNGNNDDNNNNSNMISTNVTDDNSCENENAICFDGRYPVDEHIENDYADEDEDYDDDNVLHEIITHDMTSSTSTTNQKHIVLTIKKTPTKQKNSSDGIDDSSRKSTRHNIVNESNVAIVPASLSHMPSSNINDNRTILTINNAFNNGEDDHNLLSSSITEKNDNNENNMAVSSANVVSSHSDSKNLIKQQLFDNNKINDSNDFKNNKNNNSKDNNNRHDDLESQNEDDRIDDDDDHHDEDGADDDVNDVNKCHSTVKFKTNYSISNADNDDDDDECDSDNERNYDIKNKCNKGSNDNNDNENIGYHHSRKSKKSKRKLTAFKLSPASSSSSSSSSMSSDEQSLHSNADDSLSDCANDKDNCNKTGDDDINDIAVSSNNGLNELPEENNGLLKSFNHLTDENRTGLRFNCERNGMQQFKEWHEVCQVRSYNDELLTILPYVVID